MGQNPVLRTGLELKVCGVKSSGRVGIWVSDSEVRIQCKELGLVLGFQTVRS